MPISGKSSINLAKAVTIPGAPWQKWTSFTFCDPALVAKLPLIKCLSKKATELFKMPIIPLRLGQKSLYFTELKRIHKFPPNPWAPPKYSLLPKQQTKRKSSGNFYKLTTDFVRFSQFFIPYLMIICVSSFDSGEKLVLKVYAALSQFFWSYKTEQRNPGTPYNTSQYVLLLMLFFSVSKHLQILCQFFLNYAKFFLMKAKCIPQTHTQTYDIQNEKQLFYGFCFSIYFSSV